MAAQLLELYAARVDSVYKMWHWPATMSATQPRHEKKSTSARALESAVFFMASCTISDAESKAMFSRSRQILLTDYRLACERLLSSANLVSVPNLTSLHAFILYLVGLILSYYSACCVQTFLLPGQKSLTWPTASITDMPQ